MDVHAAVVRSFDDPPRYEPFDLPAPSDGDQALVDVLAVGLHPQVRSAASGSHYTSTRKLPMVPGIDGVGRRDNGQLMYSSQTTSLSSRWPPAPSSTPAAASWCPTAPT
jgi:hypothetical protein